MVLKQKEAHKTIIHQLVKAWVRTLQTTAGVQCCRLLTDSAAGCRAVVQAGGPRTAVQQPAGAGKVRTDSLY